jgi:hypothetical protein
VAWSYGKLHDFAKIVRSWTQLGLFKAIPAQQPATIDHSERNVGIGASDSTCDDCAGRRRVGIVIIGIPPLHDRSIVPHGKAVFVSGNNLSNIWS